MHILVHGRAAASGEETILFSSGVPQALDLVRLCSEMFPFVFQTMCKFVQCCSEGQLRLKAQALDNLGAGVFHAPRALQDMAIEDDQCVLALVDERARVLVGLSSHTTQPFEDAVLQLVAGG